MKHSLLKISLFAALCIPSFICLNAQGIPEEYRNQTISQQLDYLEEHTRVYENFRAVREDIFQLLTRNVNDSLAGSKRKINNLIAEKNRLNSRIDSLNNQLAGTSTNLDEMTRSKNSIKVLGIEIHKATYNSIMWSILGVLLLLLGAGYLTFKQNRTSTVKTRKELDNLRREYEDYRQKTRVEREKATMEHFNEIKKIKSGLPGSRPK
jgi:cell division protein FtsB